MISSLEESLTHALIYMFKVPFKLLFQQDFLIKHMPIYYIYMNGCKYIELLSIYFK